MSENKMNEKRKNDQIDTVEALYGYGLEIVNRGSILEIRLVKDGMHEGSFGLVSTQVISLTNALDKWLEMGPQP